MESGMNQSFNLRLLGGRLYDIQQSKSSSPQATSVQNDETPTLIYQWTSKILHPADTKDHISVATMLINLPPI
jgi:hypothetical protein